MAASVSPVGSATTSNNGNVNYGPALAALTTLFFMWGFITVLNDILIPHLKALFDLNYTQSMLIQFTFFGAYFIVSLPAGRIIKAIGYQKGIVLGLGITGIGALLFYPASVVISYPFFLVSFFILAAGITILQVAANPFVAILGTPRTASSRLNMTQGFNSLGTTIGPVLGGILILSEIASASERAEAVQLPYIIIALTLFAIAAYFLWVKLPEIQQETYKKGAGSAWDYKHLVFGAIGIFVYVGAEVSIGSFLVNYLGLPEIGGMTEKSASMYVSVYWGGLMIGRFFGAVMLSENSNTSKAKLYLALIIIGSYILGFSLTHDVALAAVFLGLTIINFIAFKLGQNKPNRTLAVLGAAAFIGVVLTMLSSGWFAIWAVVCIGLFNSIMFPTIFTLAIDGLGEHTSHGSGILCMAIVGGAVVPLLMGVLADTIGVQAAFILPAVCYLYIVFYGMIGYKHNLGES
ncbi:MAG: sugar MFS transporter [Melioribacteraceae bacterium]|nr:sugar MFS transporter [Melioribacteraceae bacterium]MCF8266142.1 sugar MFS transporter [Melioribacteraceae bacterium]MCF8413579.1 sugar MFS transporter [Melioribacteraceae bacterium]MCF8432371.1 sugar MFS transporter [Melioribacteraceae bacterium]